MNQIIIVGNLGKDQETRFTPNGVAQTQLSVATNRWFKAKPDDKEFTSATTWHRVVAWRVPEERLERLKKGSCVMIVGRQENRSYEDKDGQKRWVSEIIADRVNWLRDPRPGGPRDEDAPPERDLPPDIDPANVPF